MDATYLFIYVMLPSYGKKKKDISRFVTLLKSIHELMRFRLQMVSKTSFRLETESLDRGSKKYNEARDAALPG